MPEKVWKTINMDYLGPLSNGKYRLVLIDQRSRYPIVAFMTFTVATSLIRFLENVFAQYGSPDRVVTDNGPPLSSTNVQDYFKSKRIYHEKITPRWARANAEVERFIQPFSKIIKVTYIERTVWENSVHQVLYLYRNTPHSVTQVPPAELMLSRKLRYTIPEISKKTNINAAEDAEQDHQRIKEKSKRYQDQAHHLQTRTINIGARILVKQQKRNKLTPTFSQYSYVVTNVEGSVITTFNKDTRHTVMRNISLFKITPVAAKALRARIVIEGEEGEHRLSQVRLSQRPREPQ